MTNKEHLIDAKDQILGRLATQVANLLRGKGKTSFVVHQAVGDKVKIINAQHIKVTGRKLEQKKYYRHSGYLGHLKNVTLEEMMEKKPEEVIGKAVEGMLPRNKLRKIWLRNLTILREGEKCETK